MNIGLGALGDTATVGFPMTDTSAPSETLNPFPFIDGSTPVTITQAPSASAVGKATNAQVYMFLAFAVGVIWLSGRR